ncbi:MAG TPA: leucine-rich repeat domain-containing protein [Candidatus Limiplasma sp.]|nr:leucine-rich repeat domain-containing protein [Candidatus Limiplasma sp.]HRX07723.1 leucine-rich repeat domain-containing protein [Candidatus Limiplasma sp.]
MGNQNSTQEQIERLIELANELEKRELALNQESKQLEQMRQTLDERERMLTAGVVKAVNDAAAKPKPDPELKPEKPAPESKAAPAPEKTVPSAQTVAEINEILQSIFWDYANSVHTISSQLSTVTAAMMCAAVTCVLENRGFDAKTMFMEEMDKLLKNGGLGVFCAAASTEAMAAAPAPAKATPPAPPTPEAPPQVPEPEQESTDDLGLPAQDPVQAMFKAQEGRVRIASVAEFHQLGEYGYRNDDTIVRVELPEGVQTLPGSFFYGCRNLEEVWLPDSLQEIGPYAFYGCEKLHAVHLSESSALREVGEYAFAMCAALQTFDVPQKVETLGTSVFRFCSSLQKLTIPKDGNLRSIGSHLLQNCTALEKLRLPDAITTIPTSMFYGCSALRKVTAKGVDTIEDYAFYDNESLRTIRIRSKKSIAAQAFEGCDPSLEIEYLNY